MSVYARTVPRRFWFVLVQTHVPSCHHDYSSTSATNWSSLAWVCLAESEGISELQLQSLKPSGGLGPRCAL